MPSYSEFFLNAGRDVIQLELLEISHPSFSQVYRRVRNAVNGVTVTLETAEVATFDYYPMKVQSIGARDDLDQGFKISLGDLGTVIPQELDNVKDDDSFATKPSVVYRAYRSDDLSAPMLGPLHLEIGDFTFNAEGTTFEARAPRLNINGTGALYEVSVFTSLRGYL